MNNQQYQISIGLAFVICAIFGFYGNIFEHFLGLINILLILFIPENVSKTFLVEEKNEQR